MTIQDQKAELRQQVAAAIGALSPAVRAAADRAVIARAREYLRGMLGEERKPPPTIIAYMPLADEVDLLPWLKELSRTGRLALPRLGRDGGLTLHFVTDLENEVEPGPYRVREPRADLPAVNPAAIDLVLVPGRAFSPVGARLGRGKGFYDRLLRGLEATRLAPAYDCQVIDEVPCSQDDEPVDVIVTPTRVIKAMRER